jgi:hypothetical protein
MFTTIALLALFSSQAPETGQFRPAAYRPRVELWTNHGDAVYTRGQNVRVYFRADRDAYVTILRVDTDGRVRVLFPRDPWEDNFARGGRDYEIEGHGGRDAFYVDDYPGVGYVFAVVASDPFVYDRFVSGDHWDYRTIADGRVRGDPYVALTDIANRIVPPDYAEWDYDLVPYYVERHYDYPRFLCYDCHTYASWVYWNPYYYSCVRFRIVVYDDPFYYPYRYYGGTRVVFVRPYRPEPRFIFKDRSRSDVFVTRVRQRPTNERGVTGRDLGSVIARPRDRQQVDRPDSRDDRRNRPDRPSQPDRPEHPDRPNRPNQPDRPEHPDRPNRPNQPDRPEHPDRPDRPDHPNRPERPSTPDNTHRREQPERSRVERGGSDSRGGSGSPAREARPARSEPRPAPRSEPRAAPDRGRAAEPRATPRAEPKRETKSAPERREPELKRRKS